VHSRDIKVLCRFGIVGLFEIRTFWPIYWPTLYLCQIFFKSFIFGTLGVSPWVTPQYFFNIFEQKRTKQSWSSFYSIYLAFLICSGDNILLQIFQIWGLLRKLSLWWMCSNLWNILKITNHFPRFLMKYKKRRCSVRFWPIFTVKMKTRSKHYDYLIKYGSKFQNLVFIRNFLVVSNMIEDSFFFDSHFWLWCWGFNADRIETSTQTGTALLKLRFQHNWGFSRTAPVYSVEIQCVAWQGCIK